jgi:succinoglycan biosynthesis protein ExoA
MAETGTRVAAFFRKYPAKISYDKTAIEKIMSDEFPRLSIVIPVRNEERFIAQTLRYLLNQDYPPGSVEILVAVADSKDRTAEVVKEIAAQEPRIRCLRNPYGLSAGGRTLGAQMATGDIVIFIDGHVYIDNDQLFRNTVRLMREKQVSVLSRPQLLDTPHNSFFQRAVALARGSWLGHGRDSTIYTRDEKYVDPSSSGASYRKEVFEKIGYFDPAFDACEDVDFNYRCARAGFQSFTSMDLSVYYYPRSSLSALLRQMMRYGTGRYRLVRKHPETLSVTLLFPSLLIAIPLALALFSLIWPVLIFPLALMVMAYLFATAAFSAAPAFRHGLAFFFALPAVYLTIHSGLGWGFLRECLGWTFRSLWKRSSTKEADTGTS